jgi:hypothetical protein
MIVSRSRRVLFVHVQRTGGSTVSSLLLKHLPGAAPLGGQHAPATEAAELLGEETDQYFKFAFVRNPWERIVSWWKLLEQGPTYENSPASGVPRTLEAYLMACRDRARHDGPRPFPAGQMELLADPGGRMLVDEVGRYERYEDDVRRIFARLSLPVGELPRAAVTCHGHYRTYFTAEAQRLVAELYSRDVESLGYEF